MPTPGIVFPTGGGRAGGRSGRRTVRNRACGDSFRFVIPGPEASDALKNGRLSGWLGCPLLRLRCDTLKAGVFGATSGDPVQADL
jgi:hypothetical protein